MAMAFLTQSNYNLLYGLVKETHTQIEPDFFQNAFLEFGRKETGPLMDLNKKFIRKLMQKISTQHKLPTPSQLLPQQQPTFPFNMARSSKNVTFDEQLELHQQHFKQFSAPPPPPTPVFSDDLTQPSSGIDELMKKAIMERKYDTHNISPPPPSSLQQQQQYYSQRPPRKLEIGNIVNDPDIVKQDIIDIDNLENVSLQISEIPQPLQPSANKTVENLFSKLRMVSTVPESPALDSVKIEKDKSIEHSLERKQTIEQLTTRIEHLEIELAELKKHIFGNQSQNKVFNLELKERPPSPSTDGTSSFVN